MTTTNETADKIAADNSLIRVQAKGIVETVFQAIADTAGADTETSIRVWKIQDQGIACPRRSQSGNRAISRLPLRKS